MTVSCFRFLFERLGIYRVRSTRWPSNALSTPRRCMSTIDEQDHRIGKNKPVHRRSALLLRRVTLAVYL